MENKMSNPVDPNLDVPVDLVRKITRYGGLNPFGLPVWRVVRAENVLRQSFGIMRHMPDVSDDADMTDLEPERVEEGEFWTPRYQFDGWILERWFSAECWGDCLDWAHEMSEDGATPMMGEWPRHGEYYMVSLEALAEQPGVDYWKAHIHSEIWAMNVADVTPAVYLKEQLYLERVAKELKTEAYLRECDHLHASVTKPMLATMGVAAQRVRDGLQAELRMGSVLGAG
jgi:hypothetical protein